MIILASRSPQRRSLLDSIGVVHRVVVSKYPEPALPGVAPEELVSAHACGKAREVAERVGVPEGGAVLGADTVVIVGDDILGKPDDRASAESMLRRLAGKRHTVMTALCLIDRSGERDAVDTTEVQFRSLADAHIAWYLDRGEWQGRAGAYAIQGSGASLVVSVNGDASTVIGLSLGRLVGLLEVAGLTPWARPPPQPH